MIYKVLNDNGSAIHGVGRWHLPVNGGPGEWMPPIANLRPCESGYHMIESVEALLEWLGPVIWIAETRGRRVEKSPGVGVWEQARLVRRVEAWTERAARLFACDCAERVAHLDATGQSARTIAVARRYANGKATQQELSAAWDAAGDAAGDAARDAARAAAWDAAGAAAGAAARAAAWDAAGAAARTAARTAARGAAWDAARDATWGAARGVVWDAERKWQAERLAWYLDGGSDA